MSDSPPKRTPIPILLIALLLPGVGTWIYWSDLLPTYQAMIYGLTKIVYIGLPIYTLLVIEQRKLRLPRPTRAAVLWGCLTGLLILCGILFAYFVLLKNNPAIAGAPDKVAGKLGGFGITTSLSFLGMALFATIANSSMEEFYWRWFLFGRLRAWMDWRAAALLSAVGFSLHHFVLLNKYIDGTAMTLLVTSGVGLGGLIWAVLYQRLGNMYAAWISHAWADVGVFTVGYVLLCMVW